MWLSLFLFTHKEITNMPLGMVVSLYPRNMTYPPYPPLDNDEVFLCGPADEVWEYLRSEMNWYVEPKEFSPQIYSVISWQRSGAMELYVLETMAEQNTRIRMEIAKEFDKINHFIDKQVAIHTSINPVVLERLHFLIGEFGDYLLDTDIRYYEED